MNTPYIITIHRNGETIKKRSTEIRDALMETKPELLYTDVYVVVEQGDGKEKKTMERKLNLNQGRRLYNNDTMMEVFISNLSY